MHGSWEEEQLGVRLGSEFGICLLMVADSSEKLLKLMSECVTGES